MKKLLTACVVVFVVSVIVGWGGVAGAVPAPEPPTTVLIPEGDVPGRSTGCPEGLFPQSYEPDAPCGPDRCLDVDGDGAGRTMWHLEECTTGAASGVSTGGQQLPATGGFWSVLLAAGVVLFFGGLALSLLRYIFVVRRPRRDS